MRKLLITLVFIVLMIPALAQEDDEAIITVPDLTGLTAAEAASSLYQQNMLLNPIIQSLDFEEFGGTINTIGAQSPEAGTEVEPDTEVIVSVSVIRTANLLLLYDPNTWDEDDLTVVNLSEEDINLTGLVFESESTGRFFEGRNFSGRVLPAEKCFQIWGRAESRFYVPDECTDSGLLSYGIISNLPNEQHFWQDSDSFIVMQDGIYRGSCEVAEGRCELWVSPQIIAEDVTEYAYFVYNEHELVIFNRSDAQWMPLYQMRFDGPNDVLNTMRFWSSVTLDNIDFLAPQQCAIFSDNSSNDNLVDCSIIARKNVLADDIFWSDGFTVQSLHQDGIKRDCPPSSGRTICLVPRYQWDR